MVHVIDVSDWVGDEHHEVFPVGARDKGMIWSPTQTTLEGIKPNCPYLFKESIYRYPDQYWTELVAYIVSKYLGVKVPPVFPAIKVVGDETISGALIEWFYDVNTERLVHAGSYFKRVIPDFDDKTGKQHNLFDMNRLIKALVRNAGLTNNRFEWLADMALFDALIGNTDRHQENWGVVYQEDGKSRLSPLFDNGTSLGHERFIENIQGWDDNRIKAYVKRGCHHLRYERENTIVRIPHFLLVKGVSEFSEEIKNYIQQKLDNLDLEGMLVEIESLTRVDAPITFSVGRYEWIAKNLTIRLELIKEELLNDIN